MKRLTNAVTSRLHAEDVKLKSAFPKKINLT